MTNVRFDTNGVTATCRVDGDDPLVTTVMGMVGKEVRLGMRKGILKRAMMERGSNSVFWDLEIEVVWTGFAPSPPILGVPSLPDVTPLLEEKR